MSEASGHADASLEPDHPGGQPESTDSRHRHGDASLIDPALIRQLLLELEGSDIEEIEITDGTSGLILRRELGGQVARYERRGGSGGTEVDGTPIRAPLTGVYYSRPSPEQPAFAEVGGVIAAGQVVALIETMKLFNEVTAEVGGEVLRVLHADGDLVEAGNPLMYIRELPEGEVG